MAHIKSIILGLLAVLTVTLIALYATCRLNAYLPPSMQMVCSSSSGFVGAYGRSPEMQNCLAFSSDWRRAPYFNRCMWC